MTYPSVSVTTSSHAGYLPDVLHSQATPAADPPSRTAADQPLPDIAATGGAYFSGAREQLDTLMSGLDAAQVEDAPALRRQLLDFLRHRQHTVQESFLGSSEVWLDAACFGEPLPHPREVEAMAMGSLLCLLPRCGDWEVRKRAYLKQALGRAFEALEEAGGVAAAAEPSPVEPAQMQGPKAEVVEASMPARFDAVWHSIEGWLQAGMGALSPLAGQLPGEVPAAGAVVCHRDASGIRQTIQAHGDHAGTDPAAASRGIALCRNPDGSTAVWLDGQAVADPQVLDLLLLAAQTFLGHHLPADSQGRSTPATLVERACGLLRNPGPDIGLRTRAAQFALAGLLNVEVPAVPPEGAGGAFWPGFPRELLALLPGVSQEKRLASWLSTWIDGHYRPEDVLAQARLDMVMGTLRSQAPEADLLRHHRRWSDEERDTVIPRLCDQAKAHGLFGLWQLWARCQPPDEPDAFHALPEYRTPDGRERLTAMLCELHAAFEADEEFARACNRFAAECATGSSDRALIGLNGLAPMLNWWLARGNPAKELLALRSLLHFFRLMQEGERIGDGESFGGVLHTRLELMRLSRTKHLPIPDSGPCVPRSELPAAEQQAEIERLNPALQKAVADSARPVLLSPAIQASYCGRAFIERYVGLEPAETLDERCAALETMMAPYAYVGVLPGLERVALTAPVLKRLLQQVLASPEQGVSQSPVLRRLYRLAAALGRQSGLRPSECADRTKRVVAGELLDAIFRLEPAFAAAVAPRLKLQDPLKVQAAALTELLEQDVEAQARSAASRAAAS
ncbi:hypothetical protein GT347_00660 [Xylophilus rhododendri]|uniref:Uncharacterized protein n=1 Tax=Xylophilus rhododendri TaxID=2697032 RepID=A0A857IYV5_9BURK|nr:hypothetical protein [Xylophilus rhododendri]QHI96636.1 hypothetical protein GT347_00660 [Xylophilus rhododendri]